MDHYGNLHPEDWFWMDEIATNDDSNEEKSDAK